MTAGKGGRPRTGSAFERGGRWYIAVSTWRPGEPRKRWKGKCPTAPGVTLTEELARALARDAQERYDRSAWNPYEKPVEPPPAPEGETVEAYAGRWLAEREAKGLRSVVSDRGRLRTHLYPALGARPVAAVTRDELETLRDDLDELVRDGRMAWKTALNTWGIIRKLFAEAAGAKKRELRVRPDDPAQGVQPPDRGRARARTHLYPSELAAVLTTPRVELRLRRLFALAVYSYARIGELAALTAADVDLVHGVLDVHKAIDGKTGKVHAPKTPAGARLVPIEPALRPLLEQLVTEAGGGRLLAWVPAQREAAKMLRRALQEAGVRREALFADDAHRAPVTFHDLRATGITWCAVRGDEVLRLQQRAGHEDVATTQGYVREAENLRAHYGAVFAPLPPVLLVGSVPEVVSPTTARERSAAQIPGPDVVPAAGLEPSPGGRIGIDPSRFQRLRWGRFLPKGPPEGGCVPGSVPPGTGFDARRVALEMRRALASVYLDEPVFA